MVLSPDAAQQFSTYGWVLLSPFSATEIEDLQVSVSEIQNWTDSGDWLNYRELTDDGPKLCRTENFINFHPRLRKIIAEGIVLDCVSELMGEPAVLYKEKINYKLKGGAGFAPHQDAPAYPFIKKSISCMIAVDESTIENGCLEVVDQEHHALLDMNSQGCIVTSWVEQHVWQPVEMRPGDVLFFHSHTPHRSGPNQSDRDRRAVFPTFNALSEGDLRNAYYAEKSRQFRELEHTGNSVRLSLINDFQGRPI